MSRTPLAYRNWKPQVTAGGRVSGTDTLHADDFRRAKREGGHPFYLQCQPTPPISRDLGLVDLAYDAGLRSLQLSYNVQDAMA